MLGIYTAIMPLWKTGADWSRPLILIPLLWMINSSAAMASLVIEVVDAGGGMITVTASGNLTGLTSNGSSNPGNLNSTSLAGGLVQLSEHKFR